MCSRTASGTTNVASGSKPSTSFVRRTSASPRGEPWAFAVSTASGAGYAMCERSTTSDGRAASSRAAANAARSASRSFGSSTCWTCQPYASNRLPLSSVVKLIVVEPSIVMWLSS